MFGVDELVIALFLGLGIGVLWALSFVVCEIWKYAWAWVDDEKPRKNILVYFLNRYISGGKWKYPVYNNLFSGDTDGEPYGYAKDKKYEGMSIHNLREGVEFKYDWRVDDSNTYRIINFILITVFFPLVVYLCLKFYVIVGIATAFVLVAHLTRFTRRLSKRFSLHAKNKEIHVIKGEK